MDQTNYGPTSHTPATAQQGFGNISNVTYKHSRQGAYLLVEVTFTAGTHAASEAQFELPTGLVSASDYPSTQIVGSHVSSVSAYGFSVLIEPSVTYFTFGSGIAAGGVAKRTGSNISSSTSNGVYSFHAKVRIQGWTENQSAPLIIGGVTSSYQGTARIESARVATTGAVSKEYGDFINGSCTNATPQVCNFNLGIWSDNPNCTVIGNPGADNTMYACKVRDVTTSALAYDCRNTVSGDVTTIIDKHIVCHGPR